jgi:osmotically-inducible protein OsmY
MGYRDMDLDDQVRAAMRRDRELSAFRIDVNVRNGIVYLRGNVNSHAHRHALELARGVDTVAAVVDQLDVTG